MRGTAGDPGNADSRTERVARARNKAREMRIRFEGEAVLERADQGPTMASGPVARNQEGRPVRPAWRSLRSYIVLAGVATIALLVTFGAIVVGAALGFPGTYFPQGWTGADVARILGATVSAITMLLVAGWLWPRRGRAGTVAAMVGGAMAAALPFNSIYGGNATDAMAVTVVLATWTAILMLGLMALSLSLGYIRHVMRAEPRDPSA